MTPRRRRSTSYDWTNFAALMVPLSPPRSPRHRRGQSEATASYIIGDMTLAGTMAESTSPEPASGEGPCSGPDACELGYGQCSGLLTNRRVHVFGSVFFDLVYSGLPGPPRPGTEVQAATPWHFTRRCGQHCGGAGPPWA